MAVYSPTWIYLGNNPTLFNPDWASATATEADTTLAEAATVIGRTYDASDMAGVQVTGNATTGSGATSAVASTN